LIAKSYFQPHKKSQSKEKNDLEPKMLLGKREKGKKGKAGGKTKNKGRAN
jgi:hypothetical protein